MRCYRITDTVVDSWVGNWYVNLLHCLVDTLKYSTFHYLGTGLGYVPLFSNILLHLFVIMVDRAEYITKPRSPGDDAARDVCACDG